MAIGFMKVTPGATSGCATSTAWLIWMAMETSTCSKGEWNRLSLLREFRADRFVEAGRLSSEGKPFHLPCSTDNRSWVTLSFYDIDNDGDQDFFPSFGDGPDMTRITFYRNTTREHGGQLTFTRIGVLTTVSGTPLAGAGGKPIELPGARNGTLVPSARSSVLVCDWNNDGRKDLVLADDKGYYFSQNMGTDSAPDLLWPKPILFGGKKAGYSQPEPGGTSTGTATARRT